MKKSWHPLTKRNQERVWKAEQLNEQERKKMEQLKRELEEERSLEELKRLQEKGGLRKASNRLEWMYEGGAAEARKGARGNGHSIDEDMEAILLGKRRIDELFNDKNGGTGEPVNNLMGGVLAGTGTTAFGAKANSAVDEQAKQREDPLHVVRKHAAHNLKKSRCCSRAPHCHHSKIPRGEASHSGSRPHRHLRLSKDWSRRTDWRKDE